MAEENNIACECRVLIVADDADYLATLGDTFRTLSDGRWQVHTAASAAQALELLKTEKMELVLLNLNLPMPDGVQLLGNLKRAQPPLKQVVMTALPTEEQRAASLAAGADLFLEKPVSPEGLKSVFEKVCELLNWTNPSGSPGGLRRVGLADLVQMECMGRNSSVLELFHEHPLGRIFIEVGQIIHAVCGEMSGERAFHKLLRLTGGTFELRDFELPPERTINRTWEYLLGEARRQRDLHGQRAQAGENLPGGAGKISSEPAAPATEMLICSATGEVLLNWQCATAADSVKLLREIGHRAEQLIPDLQLGKLDRVEIQLGDGRAILQPRPDRLIFARFAAHPANHAG